MVENGLITAAYAFAHLLTALLISALGYWIVFRTRMAARRQFGWFVVPTMMWPVLNAVIVLAPDGPWLLGLELLYRVAAYVSSLFFVIFVITFAGRDWQKHVTVRAYVVAVSIIILSILTTPVHGWYFDVGAVTRHETPFVHWEVTPGPLNIAGFVCILFALAFSYYLLIDFYRRSRRRPRSALLVMAGGIPVGLAPFFLTRTDMFLIPTYDHSSFGIIFFAVTVTYAAFRLDLADVTPVARDRAITELSDPYLAVDDAGQVIDYNEATAGLFGLSEAQIGEPVVDIFPTIADRIDGVATDGGGGTISPSGTDRQFDLRTATIDGPRGETRGSHVILRDVTALKQRERELEEQNERLDQFASVISHDLRNPLGIARTYLNFAEDTRSSEDFDAVREAHERMDEMIENLLTLARADLSDETELISLAALASDAWETAQTAEATFHNEFEAETVDSDPSLLKNIFENLFRNAVDHNDSSPTVRVGPLDRGFYVEDDGNGIRPDQRDDVFEFGYTTSKNGSGFGMAIVREVIDVHGWTITVTESDTGGARFEIHID